MAIVDKAKEETDITDTSITLELKQVLSKHKSAAPGQDSITYEMIHNIGHQGMLRFLYLLNASLTSGKLPTA